MSVECCRMCVSVQIGHHWTGKCFDAAVGKCYFSHIQAFRTATAEQQEKTR